MNQVMQRYSGGWGEGYSTGSSTHGLGGMTVILASALLVGTGGLVTIDYVSKRDVRGYKFSQFERAHTNQVTAARAPAENLTRIRNVFKFGVSQLASLFEVSRQAVYDWQAGKSLTPENAARLEDVAKAADILAVEGIASSPHVFKRPIAGGQTLLDVVHKGESAESAVRALVQMLRREATQRAQLDARLAGRMRLEPDYSDYGAPMLDERT